LPQALTFARPEFWGRYFFFLVDMQYFCYRYFAKDTLVKDLPPSQSPAPTRGSLAIAEGGETIGMRRAARALIITGQILSKTGHGRRRDTVVDSLAVGIPALAFLVYLSLPAYGPLLTQEGPGYMYFEMHRSVDYPLFLAGCSRTISDFSKPTAFVSTGHWSRSRRQASLNEIENRRRS
jgi:hypothetical protein